MNDQALLDDARHYWVQLRKRQTLVITSVVVCFLIAVLVNYTTRPVYQATTQILIDRDTPDVLPNKELVELVEGGAAYYQTQYQLLKSRKLAQRAVEGLELQKDPELLTGPMMSPMERIQGLFGRPPRSTLGADGIPLSPAIAAFRSRIEVDPVPGTRLVNLRFNAYDETVAANAVNALAQLYIDQSVELRFTTSSAATGWLTERLAEQKAKVNAAEKALQEYSEREGLIDQQDRESLVQQQLDTLNASVLEARAERISRETLYRQLATLSPSQLATHPQVANSAAMQPILGELASLREEQRRLSQTLGDRHPEMVRLREQVQNTQAQLRDAARMAARSAESEYKTALARESRLTANLEAAKREAQGVNRKAFELGALRREVESNRQIYQDLLTRTKQTGLESKLKTTNIRIVERAEVPRAPFKPNKLRNYQVALLFGLLLGVGMALLFENFDNTFKNDDELKAHVKAPFLGMVPHMDTVGALAGKNPSLIGQKTNLAIADAYRVLRTNLIFTSAERTGRAIAVTSAAPQEGKSTTLRYLAESLATNGAKVLAIDADLRKPTLHQRARVEKTPGVSDMIVGNAAASEAIRSTRIDRLSVLPCGYIPPNPAELLGSEMMRKIIEAVRSQFDWVLIDTPPVLAMADAAVVCQMVEGVVLVVGAETTKRPQVQRAMEQIESVRGKILGVVLNKVNMQSNAYYYRQHYGDYYQSYYAEGKGYGPPRRERPRRPRAVTRPGRSARRV